MEMECQDALERSLDRASKFMKDGRNPNGLWSDFLTLAGESFYWVSGYVGYALAHCGGVSGDWLEEVGSAILDHQREDGGWSYGPGVPTDADSTSWCLLFLSGIGMLSPERREKASLCLLRHQNLRDGGFRTYLSPRDVGRYMRLDGGISFEGWLSSQLCVTAVAAQALMELGSVGRIDRTLQLIRESQAAEGYWSSYWWNGQLYATVHCMEALKRAGDGAGPVAKAQQWIANTQTADGSWNGTLGSDGAPFWTALALRGLMAVPASAPKQGVERGVDWLLANQLDDGSWASGHILRIPHPSIREPWKPAVWNMDGRAVNGLIRDHRRLFTTATAFEALSEFKKMPSGGRSH